MREEIINTIMAIIVLILACLLIYVCDAFTVPIIAKVMTIMLCGVAGWGVYRVCKMWILKKYKEWTLKRKQ